MASEQAVSVNYCSRVRSGATPLGETARTVYLGVHEGLSYIAPFIEEKFFSEPGRPEQTADLDWDQVVRRWRSRDADLLVLVAPPEVIDIASEPGDIRAVARIHQVVDTTGGREQVMARWSRREVRRGAQARRDGFHYDISHNDLHFYEFYRTMHAPTMQVRHGENARNLAEQPAFETIFQQGMLIRVHKHDMWLAGCLCQIEPSARKLNARLIGVKGGDDEYRSQGAQSFVYHAIIDWAIDSGAIDTVDFQGCEPFLTKGTFQFKRRFGARVVIPDNLLGMLRMLIRPNHSARSARDFLINNPVLTDQPANDLIVKYFRDATHPPRLDLPFESPGIAGSVVLDLDEL